MPMRDGIAPYMYTYDTMEQGSDKWELVPEIFYMLIIEMMTSCFCC